MVKRVMSERDVTVAEADKAIRSRKEEELDQFQRRALEYTGKFSKLDADTAEKLVEQITKQTAISRKEAIMIVNIMPKRPEELTALFSSTTRRFISKTDAEKVLEILESSK